MKLFFVTPNFILFLSFVFYILCTTTIQAQSEPSPLQLSAVLNKTQVKLTWTNSIETEIDYFTLERSLDGRHWEVLSQIESAGHTGKTFQYQTVDTAPYEGTSFYRLGQMDYDGEKVNSSIEEVIYEVSMEQFFMSQKKTLGKIKTNY